MKYAKCSGCGFHSICRCLFSLLSLIAFPSFPPFYPGNKCYLCWKVVLEVLLSLRRNKYPFVPADDRYWVFREADVLPGYPQPLHEYGQGVPAHKIDTAIWWEPNGYTYFFSGDRYSIPHTQTHFKIMSMFKTGFLHVFTYLTVCVQILAIQ